LCFTTLPNLFERSGKTQNALAQRAKHSVIDSLPPKGSTKLIPNTTLPNLFERSGKTQNALAQRAKHSVIDSLPLRDQRS